MTETNDRNHAPLRKAPEKVRAGKSVSLKTAIFVTLLVAVASFIVGARGNEWLANFTVQPQNSGLPARLDYSELDAVYNVLRSNYVGNLSAEDLLIGAKKGLVQATGDPYTEYFTDAEAKEFFGELDGEFSGVGAELGKRDNQLTIISTLEGSPAKEAGLMPGDAIAQVNGESTQEWSIEEAVSNIRGEKGTSVKLTILREGEAKNFDVVRDDIVDPSVRSEVLKGNIGYIRLSRFNDTDTVRLTRQAAESFKQQNVNGVILDLRGNGGGYVRAAQEVAGIWLEDGKTVVEERRDSKVVETLKASGQPILNGVPTVVLIDGASASASEIVAGAFKDYDIATLVGQTSFGKGSVQQIEEVAGGGQLKVTIAKWYTPNGSNIDGEGITPAKEVNITKEDVNADRDPQKARALEILQQ